MKFLIQLCHPAHFYLFRQTADKLIQDGHSVCFAIRKKDILEDLMKETDYVYFNIQPKKRGNSKAGMIWATALRIIRLTRLVRKQKIDILLGSAGDIAYAAWLNGVYAVNFGEDDLTIIPYFRRFVGPFIQTHLSPASCNMISKADKYIHYRGFQKLAYLHPHVFQADKSIVAKYFDPERPYFLLRFSALNALHDGGIHGIDEHIADKLVSLLSEHGDVYISSERPLGTRFETYRLHISPMDIHHILAFATLYVGDSQSMAVEAAMLGTPSVRFNDFAGKIGVLEELEHHYQLTFGIPSSQPERLYDTVSKLLSCTDLKEVFQPRRKQMLNDTIDVCAFFTWFAENYPDSRAIVLQNPEYPSNFK